MKTYLQEYDIESLKISAKWNSDSRSLELVKEGGLVAVHIPREVLLDLGSKILLSSKSKMFFNTAKSLVNNAISGLDKPFKLGISLTGTGYECSMADNKIKFKLGKSHDDYLEIPKGITIEMEGKKRFLAYSPCKNLLGSFVKSAEMLRKPNPYTGNGVFISDKYYHARRMSKTR